MNGILLVDKPQGWTSFDVVGRLRNLSGVRRVGHAGTLDPMATGLLIVLFGGASKQAGKFLELDKTYEAEITLGAVSNTDDAEGQIHPLDIAQGLIPTKADVGKVLSTFIGEIRQLPPRYSAVKIKGQRAYKLARQGVRFRLEPRLVEIHELKVLAYSYPKLRLRANVSSGTYIRSLARDVGERLGSGGYLSELRRTRIGDFSVKEAVPMHGINRSTLETNILPGFRAN
ncbi:tRNA pseudouridine(55) synthase TruB [Candidatus Microgenomates bacterium]|nr:tRNA pseudouridine(55) synthase TruB [Candidatus Microgenomates bacterium]